MHRSGWKRYPGPPQAAGTPSPQAPVVAAAATATAATRSDAADLLESARNRVFEEPEFKASDLEDLIAVAQPTPQPAPTPAPALNQSQPVGTGTDPLQTQAADVLETVRTRIFEEPTFDEDAFDELTGDAPSRAPLRHQICAPLTRPPQLRHQSGPRFRRPHPRTPRPLPRHQRRQQNPPISKRYWKPNSPKIRHWGLRVKASLQLNTTNTNSPTTMTSCTRRLRSSPSRSNHAIRLSKRWKSCLATSPASDGISNAQPAP